MEHSYTKPVTKLEREDFSQIVEMALEEDSPGGDITSESIFSENEACHAVLIPREDGVLCGIPIIEEIKNQVGGFESKYLKKDRENFSSGDILAEFTGNLLILLKVERILLNFVQYLSGIATETSRLVNKYPGITILDTRKTLPGYRRLVKYAVHCGGGSNHRIHLSDMAMIKDNHVAMAGSITEAVKRIRENFPTKKVELEIDSSYQLDEALEVKPDILLLDNFSIEDTKNAVKEIKKRAPDILIECSGGITPDKLESLEKIGGIGVSMGYLTHTTHFLDLSLDIERTSQ